MSSPLTQKNHTLTHRTLAILGLVGLLSAGVVAGHSSEAFASGCALAGVDGTSTNAGESSNPFAVGNEAALKQVGATCGLDKNYKQTASFGLLVNHTSIGTDQAPFTGVYDGGNNTITGLTVDSGVNDQGMFGVIDFATIKDLRLQDVDVSGNDQVGAIVGMIKWSDDGRPAALLSNVHVVSGTVSGRDDVGGAIGEIDRGATITNASSAADVTATRNYAGGLIGYGLQEKFVNNPREGSVSQSSASGTVTAAYGAGGFLGALDGGGSITSSFALGEVHLTTNGGEASAGGFVGDIYIGSTITNSFSAGGVNAPGSDQVGGFVGGNYGGNISNSYSTGNVTGARQVGGFVGMNVVGTNFFGGSDFLPTIDAVYSTGNVTGSDQVGGFVGLNDTNATINSSYSLGSAAGTDGASEVGGFVGENNGTITNSFWDSERSGLTTSVGATGKTTAEMISIATYNTVTAGLTTSWPIVAASAFGQPTGPPNQIWGIGTGVNCGYPFLYWQTASAITCANGGGGTDSSQTEGSASEKQASSPAIHLDLQATVGQQVTGRTVVVGGQGLAPGSTMTLIVRSTPQTLVTGRVNSLGNFSTKINLPALAPGSHALTLTGTAPNGSLVTLTQGFTISATGTFSALGPVTGGQTLGLAATGPAASVMWSGIAGLGLLFAGLALTVAKNNLRVRQSR